MIEKVSATIKKHSMIQPGERIIAGVSGGADSVALLYILKELGLELFVVHVNHGIRGEEADRDAVFVENLCKKLNLSHEIIKADVPGYAKEHGMSLEEAGRTVRYRCFEESLRAQNGDKIAVAHNLNDRAETVLMRLVRGTGMTGLGSIPYRRGHIIRPLLDCTRGDIEDWLNGREISYSMDSTNLETDYTRNKIRLDIIPKLQEINGKAIENMAKTSQLIREEDQYIEQQARTAFEGILENAEATRIVLDNEGFKKLSAVIQRRVIRLGFDFLEPRGKDLSYEHIDGVLKLSQGQSGKSIDLPLGRKAGLEYSRLILTNGKGEKSDGFSYNLTPDEPVYVPQAGIWILATENQKLCKKNGDFLYTKSFDCDRINDIIKIRTRKPSDRIIIHKTGGTKKIKDYFIDEKIPRNLRETMPLIALGSEILWVIGHRTSAFFEAGEDTKRVLYIQVWEAGE